MKHLHLLLILCLPLYSLAQNWSCIPAGDTIYYLAPDSTMHALFAEDVVSDTGGFDRLIFMKGLKEDTLCEFYYLGAQMYGEKPTKPLWSGGEALVYANGLNIFFNAQGDSISIQTLAGLGDTWVLYANGPGNVITATVSAFSTTMVNGLLDSLKTISLSATGSLAQWDSEELILSKYSGLRNVPHFYDFPSKQIWQATPLKPLTVGEVYNYSIGDEFQLLTSIANFKRDYNYYLVTDKWFNLDSSNVTYTFYHELYSKINTPNGPSIIQNTDTVTYTYGNLSNFVAGAFPDKFYYSFVGTASMYLENYGITKGKKVTRMYPLWDTYVDSTDCVNFAGGDGELREYHLYVEGIGRLKRNEEGYHYWEDVIYYRSNGQSFGTRYTTLDDVQAIQFEVFPNPAHNNLTVTYPQGIEVSLILSDITGKKIIDIPGEKDGSVLVETAELPQGLYLLQVTHANSTRSVKVIVQH